MYRISKGDIMIEVSTDAELAHAVKVLTDQNVPIPSTFGIPSPAQVDSRFTTLGPTLVAHYRRVGMAEHLIKHPDDPGVTDVPQV
jgi:hypothetical protein